MITSWVQAHGTPRPSGRSMSIREWRACRSAWRVALIEHLTSPDRPEPHDAPESSDPSSSSRVKAAISPLTETHDHGRCASRLPPDPKPGNPESADAPSERLRSRQEGQFMIRAQHSRTTTGAQTADLIKDLTERLPATFVYAGINVTDTPLFTGTRGAQLAGRATLVDCGPSPPATAPATPSATSSPTSKTPSTSTSTPAPFGPARSLAAPAIPRPGRGRARHPCPVAALVRPDSSSSTSWSGRTSYWTAPCHPYSRCTTQSPPQDCRWHGYAQQSLQPGGRGRHPPGRLHHLTRLAAYRLTRPPAPPEDLVDSGPYGPGASACDGSQELLSLHPGLYLYQDIVLRGWHAACLFLAAWPSPGPRSRLFRVGRPGPLAVGTAREPVGTGFPGRSERHVGPVAGRSQEAQTISPESVTRS